MGFPSIEQFRNVIHRVRTEADRNREPLPTLEARGTVKVHGTNAGVSLRGEGLVCYSRNRVITPEDDNLGFAKFVQENEEAFLNLFHRFDEVVEIRGEWCGKGIQKGVAVNQLDKMFIIFSISTNARWYDLADYRGVEAPDSRIFNVHTFGTYYVDVDFKEPQLARNIMEKLTLDVEERCPVGQHFGVEGVGEGLVWTFPEINDSKMWFKTKGRKHRGAKPKQLVEIDVELMANVKEFVETTVTEQRLEQGVSILAEAGKPLIQSSTGDFLKWVAEDILKEEGDRLEASGLTKKDVTRAISGKARAWWFTQLDDEM